MKLGQDIVKYRYIIMGVFVGLVVLACCLFPSMMEKVNYDFTSYLPKGYMTSDGYDFLSQNFNIHGDVEIGIFNPSPDAKTQIEQTVTEISSLEGVSMAVWAGSLDYFLDFGVYKETDQEFKDLLSILTDGKNWAVLVTLEYPPSSREAMVIYDEITAILNQNHGDNFYCSGMTMMAGELYSGTVDELWLYMLIAVILVVIILAFTTNSIMEPVILLMSIGISVLINLGTNAIFPSTSIVTFACSAILQLGLSMDYAIFLLHQYRHELKSTLDPKEALARAIPKSAKAIFSSALTTMGGLLALMVMKFEIGADLGIAVAKGILLSFLTVVLLQPCLMLLMDKARIKTEHKCFDFKFRPAVKGAIKNRKWIALLFVPVICFSVLINLPNMPWTLDYTYVHFMETPKVKDEMKDAQALAIEMGNQVIIAVPCYNYEINDKGNIIVNEVYVDKQYQFVDRLDQLKDEGKISYSLGLFPMIPQGKKVMGIDMETAIKLVAVLGDNLTGDMEMLRFYVNAGYTLYTVGINDVYDVESAESFAILDEINAIASDIFGEYGPVYMTGYTQASYDFAKVTPTDFMWVTLISVLVIFAILLFSLGSLKYSVMLVALIECGIWINLLLQWVFSGGTINFMSYMVIGAVQLGATVDYAILIATRYREYRKRLAPTQASYMATTSSAMAVTTSACILASATAVVALISTNLIIKELCFLVARGAIISALLVLFVLPALLVVIDRRDLRRELPIPLTPRLRKWHFKSKKS
ncbi:MAG: MMPL family transporter [Clostridia bacterium]|nr:MMPL family transporter [Clostridia bacterium]